MNIIITGNNVEYSASFLKVNSLGEACNTVGSIDVLVYNDSSESSSDKIKYLGEIKDRVKTILYICCEENVDVAVKMMVIGSNGKYFDDEFFLESENELLSLTNSLEEVTALAELGGVNVLSDFMGRYLNNGSSDFTPTYLSVVKDAVTSLITEYNDKNLEIIQMSETATDIFSHTSSLLSGMKDEQDNLKKLIENLSETAKENAKQAPMRVGGSSVMFFPRVNYMKERRIIRVKDLGGCMFATSFMLGLRLYLESIKNIRTKLIVCTPVGDVFEKRYEDYSWVKPATLRSMANYYNSIVFTNYPSKDVLTTLLDDQDYDLLLVLDKTTSDDKHVLNSKGASVKYAINGSSSIQKFKLNKKDCFSSIYELGGTMFTVPLFPEYPSEKSERERFYLSQFKEQFETLVVIRGY